MDILTANDRVGEYPGSYYAATAEALPPQPAATGDISCDVCIIGGGFTGISTALHLREKGYDVILLDAHRLGWGASGRNGGQLHTGMRRDQDWLEGALGRETAHALWDLSQEAISLFHELVDRHQIDCGYVPGLVLADHKAGYVSETHAYAAKLNADYGYDKIRAVDKDEMHHLVGSQDYHGGALDMGSGHLHPLRYALGLGAAALKAGVRVYERTRVTNIERGAMVTVSTSMGAKISAAHVVVCCNGYLGDLEKSVARRVMPINNYIAATEPLSDDMAESLIRNNYAVADSRFVINYYRLSQDRRLLFGGGEGYGYKFPTDIAAKVRKPMLEVYPQLKDIRIEYAWGGTLGISFNRMPVFRRLSDNIINLSGFSGQGVALCGLAGKIAAETIDGQASRFDLIGKIPQPTFPGGMMFRWPLMVLGLVWFGLRDRV